MRYELRPSRGARHATAHGRSAQAGPIAAEMRRLKALAGGLCEWAATPLLRFLARPTASTLIEMHSWCGEFPELAEIERELNASRAAHRNAPSAPVPFAMCESERARLTTRSRERADG